MKTVLVTGGCGFIGQHLVRRLLLDGYKVRVLDNGYNSKLQLPKKATLISADCTEPESVTRACSGVDCVFHLAAIPSVAISERKPLLNQASGEVAALTVLEAARKSSVRRAIFASSAAVYGPPLSLPIRESHPLRPVSAYGVSKLATEAYARLYGKSSSGTDTVCLRFFNVYGPGQTLGGPYAGVVAAFIEAVKRRQSPVFYGDGRQTRDLVWVDDVVEASLRAMKHPAEFRGEAINVGTGTSTSIKDIWETLASIANVKMAVKYAPMRSAEIKHSVADCSKLEYLMGLKITNRLGENLTSLYLRCGEKT